MHGLLEVWQSEQLAIIHACGAPDESRSHFKAMELMERGVEDERGPASGWIGRHLATLNTGNSSPLRAVGMGTRPQRSLSGSVPVSALRSIADFHLGGDQRALQQMRAALNTVYEDDVLGQDTLSIMDTLQMLDPLTYQHLHVRQNILILNLGLPSNKLPCSSKRKLDSKSQRLMWAAGIPISRKARAPGKCPT